MTSILAIGKLLTGSCFDFWTKFVFSYHILSTLGISMNADNLKFLPKSPFFGYFNAKICGWCEQSIHVNIVKRGTGIVIGCLNFKKKLWLVDQNNKVVNYISKNTIVIYSYNTYQRLPFADKNCHNDIVPVWLVAMAFAVMEQRHSFCA